MLLASISCVASASKPVLALLLMKGAATLPPLSVLWYDSFFSFLVMIAIWSASGERSASIAYMQEHKSTGLVVVLVGRRCDEAKLRAMHPNHQRGGCREQHQLMLPCWLT